MHWTARTLLLLSLAAGAVAACKAKGEALPAASASPAPSIVVNALSQQKSPYAQNRTPYVGQPVPSRIPIPSGPHLAILAGQGVGPIRIGATVATIERHMNQPCEVKTETLCRYIGRAVDFHLENGVVKSLMVQRLGRPAGKDGKGEERTFGIFNGAIPPDFQVMMLQSVLEEHLGPPLRKEKVADPGAFHTIERHYYDGLVAEYDRYDNGNMVLGGVRVEKSAAATPPGANESSPASGASPSKN